MIIRSCEVVRRSLFHSQSYSYLEEELIVKTLCRPNLTSYSSQDYSGEAMFAEVVSQGFMLLTCSTWLSCTTRWLFPTITLNCIAKYIYSHHYTHVIHGAQPIVPHLTQSTRLHGSFQILTIIHLEHLIHSVGFVQQPIAPWSFNLQSLGVGGG